MNESSTTEVDVLPPDNATAGAIEQMTRAEIDMQVATARKYGRPDLSVITKRVLDIVCRNQESAERAFYTLRRKGKDGEKLIQGPSIRLMEAAIAQYQHSRVDAQVIHVDTTSATPHVLVSGVCHDLLNNVAIRQVVRRTIHAFTDRETGQKKVTDDAITMAVNSAASFAIRNSARRVLPDTLVQEALTQAKRVAVGDAKSLADRRALWIERLGKLGVDTKRVLATLNRAAVQDITAEDLETLIGLASAIRDEQMTIDEAFPEPATVTTSPAPVVTTAAPVAPEAAATRTRRARADKPKVADPDPTPPQADDVPMDGPTPMAQPEPTPPAAETTAPPAEGLKIVALMGEISASFDDLRGAIHRMNLPKIGAHQFGAVDSWAGYEEIPAGAMDRLLKLWPTLRGHVLQVKALAKGGAS